MGEEGGSSSAIFFFLGVAILLTLVSWSERREPNLKHIPTFGRSKYVPSYFDALLFSVSGFSKLQRGYDKYRPGIFKVATLHRWLVIVTGSQHIEELRKATEEELSVVEVRVILLLHCILSPKIKASQTRSCILLVISVLPFPKT